MNDIFSLQDAQRYWRFVPSGRGKHDTADLSELPNAQLEAIWNDAFASRFRCYPEEDCFAHTAAARFKGKRILSIGSGLGFHELLYQKHGAQVTCCDIVLSNLEVIRRVCALKRLPPVRTLYSPDTAVQEFGGPFDVVFIYGSLMTMPPNQQHRLLTQVKRSLETSGEIVLMLYTWRFAELTCGWKSKAEFDPVAFARVSDPSVGDEHCPWSDWHDDGKLRDIAGADMQIIKRQLWAEDLFIWYSLGFKDVSKVDHGVFFPASKLQESTVIADLPTRNFQPVASTVSVTGDGLRVETATDHFGYALVSHVYSLPRTEIRPNALQANVTLLDGGLSVGVLDSAAQTFLNSKSVTKIGRHTLIVPFPSGISQYQVIFSNHRPESPSRSSFLLHGLEVIKRPTVIEEFC